MGQNPLGSDAGHAGSVDFDATLALDEGEGAAFVADSFGSTFGPLGGAARDDPHAAVASPSAIANERTR